MISFLRGRIHRIRSHYIELDVHGVGYAVWAPEPYIMTANEGMDAFLYTHHSVREDAQQLFGFATELEREWFERLIAVSGIGPKGALQIVSATTVDMFTSAVLSEDVAALSRLPGIGKKTAQRIVVELKDKLDPSWAGEHHVSASTTSVTRVSPSSRVLYDVVEALTSLGYNEKQATEAAKTVLGSESSLSLEQALKLTLQQLDTMVSSRSFASLS